VVNFVILVMVGGGLGAMLREFIMLMVPNPVDGFPLDILQSPSCFPTLTSASRARSRSRERRASTPALAAIIATTRTVYCCAASRCGSRLSGGQER